MGKIKLPTFMGYRQLVVDGQKYTIRKIDEVFVAGNKDRSGSFDLRLELVIDSIEPLREWVLEGNVKKEFKILETRVAKNGSETTKVFFDGSGGWKCHQAVQSQHENGAILLDLWLYFGDDWHVNDAQENEIEGILNNVSIR